MDGAVILALGSDQTGVILPCLTYQRYLLGLVGHFENPLGRSLR